MKNTYHINFITRDCINGDKWGHETYLSSFDSNKYVPIPNIGDTVALDEKQPNLYVVEEVDYCYPFSKDEEYEYEIDIIVRERK